MTRLHSILLLVSILILPLNGHAKKLTLENFYNNFNIRTMYNSFRFELTTYCGDYPKDFFTQKEIDSSSNNEVLFLTNNDHEWGVWIVDENNIGISDRIPNGMFRRIGVYTVKYNKEKNEFYANQFFIPEANPCTPYPLHDK